MLNFGMLDAFRNIDKLPLRKPYTPFAATTITMGIYFLEIFVFIMSMVAYTTFRDFQVTSSYISAINNATTCVMISKVIKESDALDTLKSISPLGYGYINPGTGNSSDYICQGDLIGNYRDVLVYDAYFQTLGDCQSSLGVNCYVSQEVMPSNQTTITQYTTTVECNITKNDVSIVLLSQSGYKCRATSTVEINPLITSYYVPSVCHPFANHPPYACSTESALPPLGILSLSISLAFGFLSFAKTAVSVFGKLFRVAMGDYSSSDSDSDFESNHGPNSNQIQNDPNEFSKKSTSVVILDSTLSKEPSESLGPKTADDTNDDSKAPGAFVRVSASSQTNDSFGHGVSSEVEIISESPSWRTSARS